MILSVTRVILDRHDEVILINLGELITLVLCIITVYFLINQLIQEIKRSLAIVVSETLYDA